MLNINNNIITEVQFAGVTTKAMIHISCTQALVQHFNLLEYQINKDYSFHQAQWLFGPKARDAALKEMEQLHLRATFEPLNSNEMTKEQHSNTLKSHT